MGSWGVEEYMYDVSRGKIGCILFRYIGTKYRRQIRLGTPQLKQTTKTEGRMSTCTDAERGRGEVFTTSHPGIESNRIDCHGSSTRHCILQSVARRCPRQPSVILHLAVVWWRNVEEWYGQFAVQEMQGRDSWVTEYRRTTRSYRPFFFSSGDTISKGRRDDTLTPLPQPR